MKVRAVVAVHYGYRTTFAQRDLELPFPPTLKMLIVLPEGGDFYIDAVVVDLGSGEISISPKDLFANTEDEYNGLIEDLKENNWKKELPNVDRA